MAHGTVETTKVTDLSSIGTRSTGPQRVAHRSLNRLNRGFTDCWCTLLNHNGVDTAGRQLKAWAEDGRTILSTPDATFAVVGSLSGVSVYYCINAPNRSGNLNIADINYAFLQMDNKCEQYSASYFQWDGSVEIVGKAVLYAPICQG